MRGLSLFFAFISSFFLFATDAFAEPLRKKPSIHRPAPSNNGTIFRRSFQSGTRSAGFFRPQERPDADLIKLQNLYEEFAKLSGDLSHAHRSVDVLLEKVKVQQKLLKLRHPNYSDERIQSLIDMKFKEPLENAQESTRLVQKKLNALAKKLSHQPARIHRALAQIEEKFDQLNGTITANRGEALSKMTALFDELREESLDPQFEQEMAETVEELEKALKQYEETILLRDFVAGWLTPIQRSEWRQSRATKAGKQLSDNIKGIDLKSLNEAKNRLEGSSHDAADEMLSLITEYEGRLKRYQSLLSLKFRQ